MTLSCELGKENTDFGMIMSRSIMDSFANNSLNPQRRSGLDRRTEAMPIFGNYKYWLTGRRAWPEEEQHAESKKNGCKS